MAPTADDKQDGGERRVLVPKFSEIAIPDPQEGFRLLAEMKERGVPPDIIMQTISALAAREKCIQEFRKSARYNAQTGLYSHHALEEEFPRMQSALARANHGKTPADRVVGALVFSDIVGMKQINDTHGHHVGDEAVYQVAMGAQGLCHRQGDMALRLHETGDEVVLVFNKVPKTFFTDAPGKESALKTGMRNMQRNLLITTPTGRENFGLRYHVHTFDENTNLEDLLMQSDPKLPGNVSKVVTFDAIANQPSIKTGSPPPAPGANAA